MIEPARAFREMICIIPGLGLMTADVVVAEIGADMSFGSSRENESAAASVVGSSTPAPTEVMN